MPTELQKLPELPQQPHGLAWPDQHWPRATLDERSGAAVDSLADELFALTPAQGVTYALLVIRQGQLVYERYEAGASAFYLQYSWSMAKSITHALVGILVGQGKLDVHAPAPVAEWQKDSRREITLDHLLRMASGLAFVEDYVDGEVSDVIAMLNFEGRHDTGGFAANKDLLHTPGSQFSYSSGTTNIICRILRDIVGGGPTGMLNFMRETLFEPIGMHTATPRFDSVGTFIGSSYLLATPQDFARFGYLYLRDGMWDGTRILPAGWVDYARTPWHNDGEYAYGAHWWMDPSRPDRFHASGYDGQRIIILPQRDAVIVRCGRTPEAEAPYLWARTDRIGELL